MKFYNKYLLQVDAPPSAVPILQHQIAEFKCPYCNRPVRAPVPQTYVDWEIVAKDYRAYAQKVVDDFDRIVKDIDVMQPEDNPIRKYLQNEWAVTLEKLRQRLGE